MNIKRIRELAEQAGMNIVDDKFSTYGKFAEKFAELITAEEREACAKVCESLEIPNPDTIEGLHPDYVDGKRMAVMQSAKAIRARGNDA